MRQIIFTLLFLTAAVAFNATAQQSTAIDADYLVKPGDGAPDFSITFPSGETKKLSDMKGKVVMLQFTASWCGVCRAEMPHIEKEIWQRHKENPNFVLWGVDFDESATKVENFSKTTGVTYPLGLDPKGHIFHQYAKEKSGVTRNAIIGKDGKIVMLTRLFKEAEFEEMVKLIDRLLKE